MDFPSIMFTKENEPDSTNTIHYVSNFHLLPTVEVIVGPTMWDHVLKSPLGVIVQFRRLNFGWSSKIVHHHVLSKQLVCENEYELWFLIRGQLSIFGSMFSEINYMNHLDLLHHVTDKCGDACDCIAREDKGCSLSSCPVKYMKITGFRGTIREMTMIKHFLESFPHLKEMKIYIEENDPTEFEVPGMLKLVSQILTHYDKFFSCDVQFLVYTELCKKWPAE